MSEKREVLRKAFITKSNGSVKHNEQDYQKKKEDLKLAYNVMQENYIKEKIDELNNATINKKARLAWQIVNDITGRKHSTQGKLRAENPEQRLGKWKDYFEDLLGKAPNIDEAPIQTIYEGVLPINTGVFTMKELQDYYYNTSQKGLWLR